VVRPQVKAFVTKTKKKKKTKKLEIRKPNENYQCWQALEFQKVQVKL
jgi:hypothetical protein